MPLFVPKCYQLHPLSPTALQWRRFDSGPRLPLKISRPRLTPKMAQKIRRHVRPRAGVVLG